MKGPKTEFDKYIQDPEFSIHMKHEEEKMALTERIATLESENARLTSDLSDLSDAMDRAGAEISGLESELSKAKDRYRKLENDYVLLNSLLEWMMDVLDGKEMSDFALSFPSVRRVDDMVRMLKQTKKDYASLREAAREVYARYHAQDFPEAFDILRRELEG